MAHKCFISFKHKDEAYRKYIQDELHIDMIDKSLKEPIKSENPDYIMSVIRRDYLKDSTVTICLIGEHSSENDLLEDQYYIKKELQASLTNFKTYKKSGILGVVLPEIHSKVYKGDSDTICNECEKSHNIVNINDSTVIKEFSYNYYIPNEKCSHGEDDRYCVLTSWSEFIAKPDLWIEKAFKKRNEPIANKTKVRP